MDVKSFTLNPTLTSLFIATAAGAALQQSLQELVGVFWDIGLEVATAYHHRRVYRRVCRRYRANQSAGGTPHHRQ